MVFGRRIHAVAGGISIQDFATSVEATGRREVRAACQIMSHTNTRQEVATHFKLSLSTVDRLIKRKEIPFVKRGRLVRFCIDRVEEYFERVGKVEPKDVNFHGGRAAPRKGQICGTRAEPAGETTHDETPRGEASDPARVLEGGS